MCSILEKIWIATHIISGSEYPTSNLFLAEILKVKKLLDARINGEDDLIWGMIARMKLEFDKYLIECNLLMSIAAILDPMQRMQAMEFAFPKMYLAYEAQEKIMIARKAILDLFEEYREMAAIAIATASCGSVASSSSQGPLWPWGDSFGMILWDYHLY